MSNPVSSVLYGGSSWQHQETGVVVVIQPNTVFTLPKLVDRQIEALPLCKDKNLLTSAQRTTITSNLAPLHSKG